MAAPLPALNLVAPPGQRHAALDLAREIERRGFAGISVSSSFGNMSQSVGLALATERIPFATAIAPIYAQSTDEFAQNAAYLHEVSGGRFRRAPSCRVSCVPIKPGLSEYRSSAPGDAWRSSAAAYERRHAW
jgi:luciferase-like monooxygenase